MSAVVGDGLRLESSVCQLSSCVTWRSSDITLRLSEFPRGGVETCAELRVDVRVRYRSAYGVRGCSSPQ